MVRNNVNDLTQIVMKTAKELYDNEKFFVTSLATKAAKVAKENPTDSTIIGFSNFLSKRANSNSVFITRAELKDVYNKLYTYNNKLAQYFTEELGIVEDKKVKIMDRDANEGVSIVTSAYEKTKDPILSEQLEDAFSGKESKAYSNQVAKEAQKVCARELNSFGVMPRKIDVVAGQSDFLICRATCETPKGQSSVLIPVEVSGSHALIPEMFLSTYGFVNLNEKYLTEHLHETAGKSYKVDAQQLLKTISEAKNSNKIRPLSDIERIVMKTAAAKETPAVQSMNDILYQQVDPAKYDVETPKLESAAEFTEKLSTDVGAAEFIFGKQAVDTGRNLIKQELNSAGYRNSQVAVAGIKEDAITYAVSVGNRFGFNVPMKVANGKVTAPKVIVASGMVFEFSPNGMNSLLGKADSDVSALAKTSSFYGVKPSQLVEQVRQAMMENNFIKAEDALCALQGSGDKVAYDTAYSVYVSNLSGRTKEASAEVKCSMPIKTAHSSHVLCGHTGLPLHKIYQDKNGDCRPLHRKQMAETSEGGFFSNSRVLLG